MSNILYIRGVYIPVEISWLVEGRISYFHYYGVVTIEEIAQAGERGIEMLEESNALLVHSIQDGRDVTEFPTNVKAMFDVSQKSIRNPKMGWLISVLDDKPILQYISSMVGKLTKTRQRFLPDVESTLEFLADVDTTLPDLTGLHKMYDAVKE